MRQTKRNRSLPEYTESWWCWEFVPQSSGICFHTYLFICQQDYAKTTEQISTKLDERIGIWAKKKAIEYWRGSGADSGIFFTFFNIVRFSVSQHFSWFLRKYEFILMKKKNQALVEVCALLSDTQDIFSVFYSYYKDTLFDLNFLE